MTKGIRTGLRENLAHNLTMMRTLRGETLRYVSDATGISFSRISSWENGGGEPLSTHLHLLAKHYGVSTEFLFQDWHAVIRKMHGILDKEDNERR